MKLAGSSLVLASLAAAPFAYAEIDSQNSAPNAPFSALANLPPVHMGQSNASIALLQKALITGGYLSGTIAPTGYYGALTQTAVQKLQTALGIQADGSAVGPKTLAKFFELSKGQASVPPPIASNGNTNAMQSPTSANSDQAKPDERLPSGCLAGMRYSPISGKPCMPGAKLPPQDMPMPPVFSMDASLGTGTWNILSNTGPLVRSTTPPPWISGHVVSVSGTMITMKGVGTEENSFGGSMSDSYLSTYVVDASRARFGDHGPIGNLLPATLTIADISAGDDIAVQGAMTGRIVTANYVEDGSLDQHFAWGGKVTSIADGSFAYTSNNGQIYTVNIAATTVMDGVSPLSVGDVVYVYGVLSGTTITAKSIHDDGKYSARG